MRPRERLFGIGTIFNVSPVTDEVSYKMCIRPLEPGLRTSTTNGKVLGVLRGMADLSSQRAIMLDK